MEWLGLLRSHARELALLGGVAIVIRLLWSRLAICASLSWLVVISLYDHGFYFDGIGLVAGSVAFLVALLWSNES